MNKWLQVAFSPTFKPLYYFFVDANIHARDHSGKKPRDVVRDTVAADVQSKKS